MLAENLNNHLIPQNTQSDQMSGGSSFTFPSSSSTSLSHAPTRTRSHLILNSYHICSHVAFQLNLARSITRRVQNTRRICSSVLPEGPPPLMPLPSGSPSGHWKTWVVGTVIAVLLSFVKTQWAPLLKLKDEFQVAVKTADKVAEVLEKAADEVGKAAGAVAGHTPENSKVHDAAVLVEKFAKEVAKDAHMVDVTLDKVEEVEQDVESLFIEPITGHQHSSTPKEPDA